MKCLVLLINYLHIMSPKKYSFNLFFKKKGDKTYLFGDKMQIPV